MQRLKRGYDINLLSTAIKQITFEDIEAFCETQVLEGVNLEYKYDFPRDLAKQFVTFSNTQGGLIIIGIEENSTNGLPEKWTGIVNDGKLTDRVHQIAANVLPFPTYEVSITNEVRGKVFILIRIMEGSTPPYSTNNDPNPWIRTGNISTPLATASREDLVRLIDKRKVAVEARSHALEFARNNFSLELVEAEKERLELIRNGNQTVSKTPIKIGDRAASFEISLMPYYPGNKIMNYQDLSQLHVTLGNHWNGTAYTSGDESIPGGKSAFRWTQHNGFFMNNQIYFNGHLYESSDVIHANENAEYEISPYTLNANIHRQLVAAAYIYNKYGYNGQIAISIRLSGASGVTTYPPSQSPFPYDDAARIKLNDYQWSFTTDSSILNDDTYTSRLHEQILKEVYWDLGLGETSSTTIQWLFAKNNWYGLKE